jgi:putative hemolysin
LDERNHEVAMVVDEYGSITGLICYEDLVEVVIGEIADRRDEKKLYTRSGKNVIITSGKLELSEFEEIFGVGLSSANNMMTVGGWLTEQLGDIPKSGSNFQIGDFFFHILAADPNRIVRLYIRKGSVPPSFKTDKEAKE